MDDISMLPTYSRKLAAIPFLFFATAVSVAGELTVSAASSLTNAFKDIAEHYEADNANTKVLLNFGASGALLQQIAKGAPVDVFASADQETMNMATDQKLIVSTERRDFVRNTLVLIVPVDSKLSVTKLTDLDKVAVQKIAIGNPASVPVGRYAQQALEAAKLWSVISSKLINTQNVRQSLDYVARGEVDAGFVYATDAVVMPDRVKVASDIVLDKIIRYPIAIGSTSSNIDEAKRFIAYVLSPTGQKILAKHGFMKP